MAMPSELNRREHDKFKEGPCGETRVQSYSLFEPDGGSLDAFGNLRVAEPFTIFDTKQITDNLPLLYDDQQVSGTATTSVYTTNTAASVMGVAASTTGERVRQSFERHNYQPGKSQLIRLTGTFANQSADLTGITSRIGLFDGNNGILFSYEGGTMNAVVRSNTSGTPADDKVAQSSWNIDKMDGTGASGITLDFTKTLIMLIDMEWLGVGRVRVGFVAAGAPIYCHQFLHSNVNSLVYMSTPNLPVRYSIANDGTGLATTMQHICSSVVSEGGQQENGIVVGISNDTTEVTATNADTIYALKGIRLNASYLDHTVKVLRTTVLMTAAGVFEWLLIFNPTVAGTFAYSQVTNTAIDEATGVSTNTVTGGTVIASDYGASTGSGGNASGGSGDAIDNALKLGSAINGTQDTIVLCVRATTSGRTFLGGLTVKQIS